MFSTKFHAVTKRPQMHPNTMFWIETLVLGPMCWIGSVFCENSRCDFVARTFALIAPFHPILHRVSWGYETIPNAHKHYETHQHEVKVQWGGSGAFVAKNYNMTSWHELLHLLHQFSMFCNKFHVVTKRSQRHPYYETHRNISIVSNGGNWLCSFHKIPRDFVTRTFVLTAAVRYVLHQVSCS